MERIDNFQPYEREVALELIDEAIKTPDLAGYRCIVAVEPAGETETPVGYICFGRTPMTEGTFDLYWIAVDKSQRNKGVGAKLIGAMDEVLLHNGGRIVRLETSSMETYQGTVQFYLNAGFIEAGRIPGFYKPGDDLVIFFKALGKPA